MSAWGNPWPGGRRWATIAAILVALIALADLSLHEAARPVRPGLRTARQGGDLVVTWVQPAGAAWFDDARPGDVVLAIDGRPVDARDAPDRVATAATLTLRAPDGRTFGVDAVATSPLHNDLRRASLLFLALSFAALGGGVFLLAADMLAASVLLGLTTLAATALIAVLAIPTGAPWAFVLVYVALVCGSAALFLLFLVFPVNRLRQPIARPSLLAFFGVHATLLLLYGGTIAVDSAFYTILRPLTFVVETADLVGAMALAALAARREARRRRAGWPALRLIALGTIAGLGPVILLTLLPQLFGIAEVVPAEVAILSVILLPLSLGAAVLSRQYFGITRLVRRGVVALLVWTGLVSAYSLLLSLLWPRLIGEGLAFGGVALIVALVAGTFPAIQRGLRGLLEQALFRDVYDYAGTLRELSAEVAHLTGDDAIARHVLQRLGETLNLSWAAIALKPEAGAALLHAWGDSPPDLDPCDQRACKEGERAPRRRDDAPVACLPLVADRAVIGTLSLGPKRQDVDLLPEDLALVATLTPLVATALQNALLVQRLRAQVAALGERERELAALSARLMQVQEEERRWLALDLHDDPLQRATLLARELKESPAPAARRWHGMAEEILVALRAICTGLRPPVLDDFGLVAGLERLVNDLRVKSDLSPTLIVETADGAPFGRLHPDLEITLYRVAQEGLNNCLKHAQASRVAVTLWRDGRRLRLRIADDGRGYGVAVESDHRTLQLGILGMRERMRPWNGAVTIGAGESGGTLMAVEAPLPGAQAVARRGHAA